MKCEEFSSLNVVPNRLKDFIGTSLDFLTFFITGVTPRAVLDKLNSNIANMSLPVIQKLCNASLIAAASNRSNVMNYLSRAENADITRFAREHYYIQDHVNFSHLNLLGHMLLAGGLKNNSNFVKEFRGKMGADSIWDCNFNKCDLSEAQKKILSEKVRRIPVDQVRNISREMVLTLATRIALLKGPANAQASGKEPIVDPAALAEAKDENTKLKIETQTPPKRLAALEKKRLEDARADKILEGLLIGTEEKKKLEAEQKAREEAEKEAAHEEAERLKQQEIEESARLLKEKEDAAAAAAIAALADKGEGDTKGKKAADISSSMVTRSSALKRGREGTTEVKPGHEVTSEDKAAKKAKSERERKIEERKKKTAGSKS